MKLFVYKTVKYEVIRFFLCHIHQKGMCWIDSQSKNDTFEIFINTLYLFLYIQLVF